MSLETRLAPCEICPAPRFRYSHLGRTDTKPPASNALGHIIRSCCSLRMPSDRHTPERYAYPCHCASCRSHCLTFAKTARNFRKLGQPYLAVNLLVLAQEAIIEHLERMFHAIYPRSAHDCTFDAHAIATHRYFDHRLTGFHRVVC